MEWRVDGLTLQEELERRRRRLEEITAESPFYRRGVSGNAVCIRREKVNGRWIERAVESPIETAAFEPGTNRRMQ
jgi:hypothetical protein